MQDKYNGDRKMQIQFLDYPENRESAIIEADNFQLSYDLIRDEQGEEVADLEERGWRLRADGEVYSDVLFLCRE